MYLYNSNTSTVSFQESPRVSSVHVVHIDVDFVDFVCVRHLLRRQTGLADRNAKAQRLKGIAVVRCVLLKLVVFNDFEVIILSCLN